MKRKIEIIETMESMLAGGTMTADQQSRYPRWLVRSMLAVAYDSIISGNFEKGGNGMFRKDQFLLDNYVTVYTPETVPPVVVEYDSVRKKYFSILPKPIIELKNNDGIRLICPVENEAGYGIPVTQLASVIRTALLVSKVNPRFTYKVENDRVYFEFPIVPYTSLMMKLIVRFDDLDDLDVVDEPTIMTKNGIFTIYDYVKQNLITMPPTKQTEDNATV